MEGLKSRGLCCGVSPLPGLREGAVESAARPVRVPQGLSGRSEAGPYAPFTRYSVTSGLEYTTESAPDWRNASNFAIPAAG